MPSDTPQGDQPVLSQEPGFPEEGFAPDLYAEGSYVISMPNSLGIVFNLHVGTPAKPKPIAVIRMSPEQAKLLAAVLDGAVKAFEKHIGPIPLAPNALANLGLPTEEDA